MTYTLVCSKKTVDDTTQYILDILHDGKVICQKSMIPDAMSNDSVCFVDGTIIKRSKFRDLINAINFNINECININDNNGDDVISFKDGTFTLTMSTITTSLKFSINLNDEERNQFAAELDKLASWVLELE